LDFDFAVLHAGGHNLVAGVCEACDEFSGFIGHARQCLSESAFAGCSRVLDEYFGAETYSLKSLFRDERKRIVTRIVDSTLADIEKLYGDVYEHNVSLIGFLRDLAMPLPPILRVSSDFVLNSAIRRSLADENIDGEQLRTLIHTANQSGIALDYSVKVALSERLKRAMADWSADPLDVRKLTGAESLISLLREAPFETDLWDVQNSYYRLMKTITRPKAGTVSAAWLQLFHRAGERLGIAVPQMILPTAEKTIAVVPLPQLPAPQLTIVAEC
jgi:hypothetical protein